MEFLHGIKLAGYEQFAQKAPPPQNQELLFEWAPDIVPRLVAVKNVFVAKGDVR
jgi:hypothetical protein